MADTTHTRERPEVARPEATRNGNVAFAPRVDIVETDNELTLYAELPGVGPNDVHLNYERGELVLHGKVGRKNGRPYLLQEYDIGDFYRNFTIHESIDSTHIEAELKNGVLVVHLPKVVAAQPRQIQVRGA